VTAIADGVVARGERVALREKRLDDAEDDFRWRSDAELAGFDAARPLTVHYQRYLAFYREELRYPNPYRRSLSIEDETGRHIGNLMYYNIDTLRQEAELGITIGERSYWSRGYGSEAVRLAVEYLLGEGGFHRVHLKTLTWNKRAQACFKRAGFAHCGRAYRNEHHFVLMEFRREWLARPRA
jgi:RimJ/RimL family protein N-acetyltransferase